MTSNGTTDTYTYLNDGKGRRVEVLKDGAVQSRYIYDENSKLVAELNPDGTIKSHFIYATGSQTPDYLIQDGVDYKIVHDQVAKYGANKYN